MGILNWLQPVPCDVVDALHAGVGAYDCRLRIWEFSHSFLQNPYTEGPHNPSTILVIHLRSAEASLFKTLPDDPAF